MAEQEHPTGEERVKDVDRRKVCPFMTAGNMIQMSCLGEQCGIWNKDAKACGLLEGRMRIVST